MSKQQKEPERSTSIGLRAPPELAAWLKQQAEANKRSLSNQTVWALDQYRVQQQAQKAVQ